MRSRWNDAEAAALSGVDLLVYASRLVGAETSLVVWGGGNTSIKTRERDHRGREIPVLRVKGSGSDLKSIQKKDFPACAWTTSARCSSGRTWATRRWSPISPTRCRSRGVRPSIETLLHGFVDAPVVIHTHADAIVSLTNNDRAADVLTASTARTSSRSTTAAGLQISRETADAIAAHPEARALLLEQHGTICWGASVREPTTPRWS